MVNTYTRMCDICKRAIAEHDETQMKWCHRTAELSYWRKDE